MQQLWRFFFWCCIPLLFFGGCFKQQLTVRSSAFVDVSYIPNGFPLGSSFYVDSEKHRGQILAKEIRNTIVTHLQDRGYVVTDAEWADYRLLFDWDVKKEVRTEKVAVYKPGKTKTIYRTVLGVRYEESVQSQSKVVYEPRQYTQYVHMCQVHVYDAAAYRDAQRDEEVWQGIVQSTGQHNEIRQSIDYLLRSLFVDFGHNQTTRRHVYQID